MATGGDNNFSTACLLQRSKAQMFLGRILNTVSAAEAAPNSQPIHSRDDGSEGKSLARRNAEKRRTLLRIDLNVAPPEDADCDLTAAAVVALDASGSEPVLFDKREPNFDAIAEEVGFEIDTKTTKISVDAEAEMTEKDSRKKRWFALLKFTENALVEKEEENWKRRRSQESEFGGQAPKATPLQRKISGQRPGQSLVAESNGENEVAAVVRSSRGRAVAMPSKYRDSVIGAAEAELPRGNKSGKSAPPSSTKRKSR